MKKTKNPTENRGVELPVFYSGSNASTRTWQSLQPSTLHVSQTYLHTHPSLCTQHTSSRETSGYSMTVPSANGWHASHCKNGVRWICQHGPCMAFAKAIPREYCPLCFSLDHTTKNCNDFEEPESNLDKKRAPIANDKQGIPLLA